jgi:HAD superfamily hydrolase (TIGR01662 family)
MIENDMKYDAVIFDFLGTLYARGRLFSDAEPVIRELSSTGLKLAILSGSGAEAAEWMKEQGIDQYFDVLSFARSGEPMKPHPEAFLRIAKKLECDPGRVLMVGDSVYMDMEGARSAGMDTILISRGMKGCEEGAISSLYELIGMMK